MASSYLQTIKKGIPKQTWTQFLSIDYVRGDKGRHGLKFKSSTITLAQGFSIGLLYNHVTKPLTWALRRRNFSSFSWSWQEGGWRENFKMWNLWQLPQKRGFHVKAGGIGEAISQGTALVHPACLNVWARRIRN